MVSAPVGMAYQRLPRYGNQYFRKRRPVSEANARGFDEIQASACRNCSRLNWISPLSITSPAMTGLGFGCVLKWQRELRFSRSVGRGHGLFEVESSRPNMTQTKTTAWK